jgi:hypothetical protein
MLTYAAALLGWDRCIECRDRAGRRQMLSERADGVGLMLGGTLTRFCAGGARYGCIGPCTVCQLIFEEQDQRQQASKLLLAYSDFEKKSV